VTEETLYFGLFFKYLIQIKGREEYCILRQVVVSIEHMVKEHGSMTNQNFRAGIFVRVQLFEMTLGFALLHAGNQMGFVSNVKPTFVCRRMLFMPRLKWLAFARNIILLRSSLLISHLIQELWATHFPKTKQGIFTYKITGEEKKRVVYISPFKKIS